jgi:hypothetical protein
VHGGERKVVECDGNLIKFLRKELRRNEGETLKRVILRKCKKFKK